MIDFDTVVIEFALQSCYYIHFRFNTIGNVMNFLISSSSSSSSRAASL